MKRRRGVTLVEVALASALTGIVVATSVGVYGFVVVRMGHAFARAEAVRQATAVAQDIEATVQSAINCELVPSGKYVYLKCTMPATVYDRQGDGNADAYDLDSVTTYRKASYSAGKRVWYVLGRLGGVLSKTALVGIDPNKAVRTDDSVPTASDLDLNWSRYYGSSNNKFHLLTELVFKVDTAAKTVTYTISASSAAGRNRTVSDATSNESYAYSVTRVVCWRNG
ncbi:MAG: prepilin-type N-terminal cleavage/methylation domain-containing protein [Fimbriimonadaceae bacterium]|nr:hypothetical protein [Fimbriimonadaceae bacterium]MCC6351026.1 prepilin-type N-terminal cleavage/methylation domain-containing protein [Fimbriimonadaceae bacterium]MCL4283937.1 prepilin-type N-terminal cleavage/methylation domain-containing protein [Fimbriimonadaceae bacterium]QOJ12758.1 MAG: prepilin-type N-terminal cleavage/methylation domain-containing protein [Chthonomonadaceae bacterium]